MDLAKIKASKYKAACLLISAKSGALGEEVMPALKMLSGAAPMSRITEDCVVKLERLGIARRDTNLLDESLVLLLTPFGKKITQVIQENPKDFGA
jgi:hypothetical protein